MASRHARPRRQPADAAPSRHGLLPARRDLRSRARGARAVALRNFYVYYTLFGAAALYHGVNGTLLALHALGARRSAAVPGGARLGLGVPVGVGTALVVLALLALGGRLFPIADPRESRYAKMWEGRFGVELGR